MKLDIFDKKILKILQNNGKMSNTSLAKEIGLTAPATLERVRKLHRNGFILGYKTILSKKKLGKTLTCFIALNLKYHNKGKIIPRAIEKIGELKEVEEINFITGRFDYIIKVNLKDVEDLRKFLEEKLTKIEFIDKIETFVAIHSYSNANADLLDQQEEKD